MPTVTINDVTIEVPDGTNLVQAAEMSGQEIPHYCYHPGLSVAGNCRMCLVEIKALSEKQPNPLPKLQIGCNTIVQEGMVVESNNAKVEEARRGVLEFLLINHPIDCPICDQAGECKLQEYYMDYGRYHSRFDLGEKVNKNKVLPIGSGIMLDQERCILCTRCIRFLGEVTETHELGVTERGDHSEVTLAQGMQVDNPYSMNIVDICPVGALTSRDFRFQARVWYLEGSESVCTGCATGCNTEVHSRRDRVYRVKPRANHEVNGFWMCDHGRRLVADNHGDHRITGSYLRTGEEFVEHPSSEVVARAAGALDKCLEAAIVVSASTSMEEGFLLARISERLNNAATLIASPGDSDVSDDGRLISTDRYPNRRGLLALGFSEGTSVAPSVDAMLVARCDLAATDASWGLRLESMTAMVVADDGVTSTAAYADSILGISSAFESEGSFVNKDGRLQRFAAAVAAPGEAVPGWLALANLLAELGGPRYRTASGVFSALCESLGLGEGRDYEWLGSMGRSIGEDADVSSTASGAEFSEARP